MAHALLTGIIIHQLAGDNEAVYRLAQRLIELADKYNFPPQRAHALILSGWVRAVGQDSDAGLEQMEAEFPRAVAIGLFFRYYAMLLAEARLKFGKLSDVLSVLRWALDSVTEPGIGWCVPELYRLKGVCLLQLDSANEKAAMCSLQMALDVAKQQKAKLFELKAAIDLAKAGSSLAQPESYLQPLRDLCANLPEAFDAPLLAEAKRLL